MLFVACALLCHVCLNRFRAGGMFYAAIGPEMVTTRFANIHQARLCAACVTALLCLAASLNVLLWMRPRLLPCSDACIVLLVLACLCGPACLACPAVPWVDSLPCCPLDWPLRVRRVRRSRRRWLPAPTTGTESTRLCLIRLSSLQHCSIREPVLLACVCACSPCLRVSRRVCAVTSPATTSGTATGRLSRMR